MADVGAEGGTFLAKAGAAGAAGALWGIFGTVLLVVPSIFMGLFGPVLKKGSNMVTEKIEGIRPSVAQANAKNPEEIKASRAQREYQRKLEALNAEREEMELAAKLEALKRRRAASAPIRQTRHSHAQEI
jgi:hypothetical protein